MIKQYIEALGSGVVNGYGYIDKLPYSHIETLCKIASHITKSNIGSREDLKEFTTSASEKLFRRYIRRVLFNYLEL